MRTNPALRASRRSYDELVCGQALWFTSIFCRLWTKGMAWNIAFFWFEHKYHH